MEKLIRGQFPLLEGDDSPIYFDNMECTVPAKCVVEKINEYYTRHPFGVRGAHRYAVENKIELDEVRKKIANFINAEKDEIIFTKDVAESCAMVASSLSEKYQSVLLSEKCHNSCYIPWLNLKKKKIDVRIMTDEWKINRNEVVVFPHVSHIDGTEMDVKDMTKETHDLGGCAFVDMSFSVPNRKIDVKALDIDFGTFSFHRMCGAPGCSILYMKKEISEEVEPLITGGGSVSKVSYDDFALLPPPEKYEPGHLNYGSIFASGTCIEFLEKLHMDRIWQHVISLNKVLTSELENMRGIRILGPSDYKERGAVCNFMVDKFDSHDVVMVMDEVANIIMRSGMHCAHAYFTRRNIPGVVGVSFYVYNKAEEVLFLAENLKKMIKEFT